MSGDFNIDLIKSDVAATTLKSILHKYDLIQLITEPTRKTAILDYIIINYSAISQASVLSNELSIFTSDHKPLIIKFFGNMIKE